MTTSRMRWVGLGIGTIAVVGAAWLTGLASRTSRPPTGSLVVAGSLEDLLMDLELLPLDGQAPKAFALDDLDGKRVTLADLRGRPALLYFWATW